jgi:hypothetical protein
MRSVAPVADDEFLGRTLAGWISVLERWDGPGRPPGIDTAMAAFGLQAVQELLVYAERDEEGNSRARQQAKDAWYEACQTVVVLGADLVPVLLALVQAHSNVAIDALLALARLAGHRFDVIGRLVSLAVGHPDRSVRIAAWWALRVAKGTEGFDPEVLSSAVQTALEDADDLVRAHALLVIPHIRISPAAKLAMLYQLRRDPCNNVQVARRRAIVDIRQVARRMRRDGPDKRWGL